MGTYWKYRRKLEADISNSGPGQIGLDDIAFLPDSCEIKPEMADPVNWASYHIGCTFDEDLFIYVLNEFDGDAHF